MGIPILSALPAPSPLASIDYIKMAPQQSVGAVPADVVAVVGAASRGPVNVPTWYASLGDFKQKFGGMTPNAATPSVPLSGYPSARNVKLQGVQDTLFVRVMDSTGARAHVTISGTGGPIVALHASSPGTWANQLTYVITQNTGANTWSLTLTNPATGEVDTLVGLPVADNAALITAINARATLVVASQPVIDTTAAPTGTPATGSGSIPAGTYVVQTTYVTATGGETDASPEQTVTLSGTGHITVAPAASPTGATAFRVYLGTASGGGAYAGQSAIDTPLVLTTLPTTALQPPDMNRATLGAGATSALPTAGLSQFPTSSGTGHRVGVDGGSPTTAQHIGASTTPLTGLYTLTTIDPVPNFVLLAESAAADTTSWATQAQIAKANGWQAIVCLAPGATDTQVLTAVQALTSLSAPETNAQPNPDGDYISCFWPACATYDAEYYQTDITTCAGAWAVGIKAVQAPNTAGYNKPVQGDCRPEFALGTAALGALAQSGINPLSAKIPTRNAVGLVSDVTLSGTDAYIMRMQGTIAAYLYAASADFVGVPNDQNTRSDVRSALLHALGLLVVQGLLPPNPANASPTTTPVTATTATAKKGTTNVAGQQPSTATTVQNEAPTYAVICDDTNNVFEGVPTDSLYADVFIQISPNIRHIHLRVAAGPQVQVNPVGATSTALAA